MLRNDAHDLTMSKLIHLNPEEKDTDNSKTMLACAAEHNSLAIINLLKLAEREQKIAAETPEQKYAPQKIETAISPDTHQPTPPSNTSQLAKRSVFAPKKIVENPEISTLRFRHFYFHYL